MKLGEIIKEYREKYNLSMSEFSKRSGISKAYIGMLESGVNPRNGKPIKPSVEIIKKCASGMHTDFDTLFHQLDEDVVVNTPIEEDIIARRHLEVYSQLLPKQQLLVDDVAEILLSKESDSDKAFQVIEKLSKYMKS